jgi:uncharacterized protein
MGALLKSLRTGAGLAGRRSALAAIHLYKTIVSPLIVANAGPACRFEPTCSEYACEAIEKFGTVRGSWMALRRVIRCRPGGGWGYDPVNQEMNDASGAA